MKGKKITKLKDYMIQHQALLADFDGSTSTQQKYLALKKTINIMNTHAVELLSAKDLPPTDAQPAENQSEQVYLRQLSKMCEEQELFQLYKTKKFAQAKTKTYCSENQTKKPSTSAHFNRRQSHCGQNGQKYIQHRQKMQLLPDFKQILMGCPVGFTGLCTKSIIDRKVKNAQKNILQPQNQSGSAFTNTLLKKSMKMKQQMFELKKQAKNLYDLDFNGGKISLHLDGSQKWKLKLGSQSLHCAKSMASQQEQNHRKLGNRNWQKQNPPNFNVPEQILLKKQKYRPLTVGLSQFRANSVIKNTHYVKI